MASDHLHGDLFHRSVRGAQIIMVVSALSSLVQLVAQVALMRLLDPEVFGAAAYIAIIVGLMRLLTLQSSKIIIQRRGDIDRLVDSAFGAELLVSACAFMVCVVFAGSLMRGSGEWYFQRELQVAALGVLAGPLTLPKVLLEKRLEFAKANLVNLGGILVAIAVQIGLALAGMGLWALIIGTLAGQLTSSVMAWLFAPYRPRPRFEPSVVKEISVFGLPLALSAALAYFYWNIDDLLVKWMMGTATLGFYSKAFRLPHFGFRAQASLSTLVFPAFSSITEKDQLRRAYGHTLKYSAYLLLLPVVMVLAHGKEIVFILFGEKWLPISVPFKIFTLLVGVRGIFNHWVDLYVSRGKTRLVTWLAVANSALIVGLGYFGIRMAGIVGMSVAVFVTVCATILVAVIWVHREYPVNFFRLLGPSVLSGIAAYCVALIMKPLLTYGLIGLSGSLAVMALVYVMGHLLLDGAAVLALWRAAWAGFGRS